MLDQARAMNDLDVSPNHSLGRTDQMCRPICLGCSENIRYWGFKMWGSNLLLDADELNASGAAT